MYRYILFFHSWWRWLVLLSLIVAIVAAWKGMKNRSVFQSSHDRLRRTTAHIAGVQFLLGIWLYFLSPFSMRLVGHFDIALHEQQSRFFGLEHLTVMLIAIAVIAIGSLKAKKAAIDYARFKIIFYWFLAGLLLILTSIPWSFSPFTARPLFRFYW